MKKNKKNTVKTSGFTLVELIVVIVIIGILAAVAAPAYQQYVKKSKQKSYTSVKQMIENAAEIFYTENSYYPTTVDGVAADSFCCGDNTVMAKSFARMPVNPFCPTATQTTYANKSFADTSDETIDKIGWTYTTTGTTTAPTDYTLVDATTPACSYQ